MSLCLGCGRPAADYSTLKLVNATGTVTLDGQPLPDAVVTFDAPDGQFSYGLTNSSGKYSLQIDSEKRGVTPGEKTVRISTTRKILGLNASEGAEEGDPATKPKAAVSGEKVPEKYNKNSELKITVSGDKTQYDFDLKSN
ncbi:MAG TPA: carboxypeptidase-like regulatory domain-containing protein [Planctomycetaceae bacterium]|nr:carboxypeptidase-like regulatory domain-containing protein [Planctomycetaceae bacterium]